MEDGCTEEEADNDRTAADHAHDTNHGTRQAERIEIYEVGSREEDADEDDADAETDEDTTESADCVCPVCGATENQIVVGEIAPIDDEPAEEPESSEESETAEATDDTVEEPAATEEPATEESTEEATESEEWLRHPCHRQGSYIRGSSPLGKGQGAHQSRQG